MLEVSELVKTFTTSSGEEVDAVAGVSFTVAAGEVFSLVGPSGCGKTTTLRCIAGLERPTSGRITIGDQVVFDSASNTFLPAHKRDLGMVFQSYAIWPHMNVFDNVAFPLVAERSGRPSRAEVRRRVAETLASVKMAGYEDRASTALSGGQQQRLAVARALVADPRLLLLDEPLSNLDVKLRHHMRYELQRIQQQMGVTTIYVTHDQEEALALSDQIAVMNNGSMIQQGTPEEIFLEPRTSFVADFIGSTNLLGAELLQDVRDGDLAKLRGVEVDLVGRAVGDLRADSEVVLGIRPERMRVVSPESAEVNVIKARVVTRNFAGTHMEYLLDAAGQELRLRTGTLSGDRLEVGAAIGLHLPVENCSVLRQDMGTTDTSASGEMVAP